MRKRSEFESDRISILLGEMIQARRLEMGLSISDVAREIGCSISTVAYHEQGAAFFPRPLLLRGLSRTLNLSVSEMVEAAYGARSVWTQKTWRKVA